MTLQTPSSDSINFFSFPDGTTNLILKYIWTRGNRTHLRNSTHIFFFQSAMSIIARRNQFVKKINIFQYDALLTAPNIKDFLFTYFASTRLYFITFQEFSCPNFVEISGIFHVVFFPVINQLIEVSFWVFPLNFQKSEDFFQKR